MALIEMTEEQGSKYRSFLDTYRNRTGKEPTATERTEAFFCAISKYDWKRPSWI